MYRSIIYTSGETGSEGYRDFKKAGEVLITLV